MSERRSVAVTIQGREFRIRSDEEPEALHQIARYVDATMERVRARTGTIDSLDVAMLTALNLAREIVEGRAMVARSAGDGERLRALVERAESAVAASSA